MARIGRRSRQIFMLNKISVKKEYVSPIPGRRATRLTRYDDCRRIFVIDTAGIARRQTNEMRKKCPSFGAGNSGARRRCDFGD